MSYDLVVRNITYTDIQLYYDGMVELLLSHLEDWHDFDTDKFKKWLWQAVDDPETDTLLCTHGHLPAGYFIARTITPVWSKERVSSDVVLYTLPPYRGKGVAVALLQQWAYNLQKRGVKKALAGYSLRASHSHARDAYKRAKFFTLGEIYARKF